MFKIKLNNETMLNDIINILKSNNVKYSVTKRYIYYETNIAELSKYDVLVVESIQTRPPLSSYVYTTGHN